MINKRDELLGMSYGTATNQLRKMLLFELVKMLGADCCYRCGRKIEKLKEFSIEHTIPWQGTENPKETFFDLSKIAYSHLSCNSGAAYRPHNKKDNAPTGMTWCTAGKHYQPTEIFTKNISRHNGLSQNCGPCHIELVDIYRRQKGLRPSVIKFSKKSKYRST